MAIFHVILSKYLLDACMHYANISMVYSITLLLLEQKEFEGLTMQHILHEVGPQ